MDTQTIYRNHISIDQNYILKLSRIDALNNTVDFINILKCWIRFSKSNTIGDITKINRNTPLLFLLTGNNTYYLNADTNREGVKEFLENKNEKWEVILNENNVKNKVTNRRDKVAIPGFYFYKEI